jgi:hypothetical protein
LYTTSIHQQPRSCRLGSCPLTRLDRLPCTVPQAITDAFVDTLHVAIRELARETDEFEYEHFYARAMGICSEV